jgi:hypothetical protein
MRPRLSAYVVTVSPVRQSPLACIFCECALTFAPAAAELPPMARCLRRIGRRDAELKSEIDLQARVFRRFATEEDMP